MLEKLKMELRRSVMYNVIFLMVGAIASNGGIDEYLLDELIDDLYVIPYFIVITAIYLIGTYCYDILAKQIRKDLTEVKTELKKNKIEA